MIRELQLFYRASSSHSATASFGPGPQSGATVTGGRSLSGEDRLDNDGRQPKRGKPKRPRELLMAGTFLSSVISRLTNQ